MKKMFILTLALIGLVACAKNGNDGATGVTGMAGANGTNGSSCSVQQTSTGAIITCTDGSSAVIMNGKDCKRGKHE